MKGEYKDYVQEQMAQNKLISRMAVSVMRLDVLLKLIEIGHSTAKKVSKRMPNGRVSVMLTEKQLDILWQAVAYSQGVGKIHNAGNKELETQQRGAPTWTHRDHLHWERDHHRPQG